MLHFITLCGKTEINQYYIRIQNNINDVSQLVKGKGHFLPYPVFVRTCDVPVSVREHSTVFHDDTNGPNIQTALNKDVLRDAINILDKTYMIHCPVTPHCQFYWNSNFMNINEPLIWTYNKKYLITNKVE